MFFIPLEISFLNEFLFAKELPTKVSNLRLLLLGCLGLEPRTNRLKAEYSTIELAAHTKMIP